jgi:hypothetical protein
MHVVIGVDPENRMYLLDLWRGQTSSTACKSHRKITHPVQEETI